MARHVFSVGREFLVFEKDGKVERSISVEDSLFDIQEYTCPVSYEEAVAALRGELEQKRNEVMNTLADIKEMEEFLGEDHVDLLPRS